MDASTYTQKWDSLRVVVSFLSTHIRALCRSQWNHALSDRDFFCPENRRRLESVHRSLFDPRSRAGFDAPCQLQVDIEVRAAEASMGTSARQTVFLQRYHISLIVRIGRLVGQGRS